MKEKENTKMKELAKRKQELIELEKTDMAERKKAFIEGYAKLKADTGFEYIPQRIEDPNGVTWMMDPRPIKNAGQKN